MTSNFDGKIAVIVADANVESSGHASNFVLKAGDTATVVSWHARDQYLNDYPRTRIKPDVAKILPAFSEHSGRLCYIRHWEIFVIPAELHKKLEGISFCITGTLAYPREVYSSVIQFCGGDFKKAVTKDLNYLIMARTDTVKAEKAKELGVKCITDKEFKSKILGIGTDFKNWTEAK